jgi:tRNA (cmo5U34)-methyltransferase
MRQGIRASGCEIAAVDNSAAMTERCQQLMLEDDSANAPPTGVDIVLGDIMDTEITNASMVVLNYTLQFLSVDARDALMRRICSGLVPGGLLVLSEKVLDENEHMEKLLFDLHHEFKRRNHYSSLEISRKRAALENVLVPETVTDHRTRLTQAGFENIAVWLRYFNFLLPNMNQGVYDIKAVFTTGARAEVDICDEGEECSYDPEGTVTASAAATAVINRTMLTVQQVRAAKDSLPEFEILEP